MKEVVVRILMPALYVAIWKLAGFEIAMCVGIGGIMAQIFFKKQL